MITKQNRLLFTDLLRVLAIFGAILIHVSASNLSQVPVDSLSFSFFNLYDSLGRFCVPIFVMLSGMLFLNPNKRIETKKIFKKYIPRIILALLFFGTAYYVFLSYLETGVKDPNFIKDGFIAVISGNARYHLWYLYMIMGLYLITPVLRVYTARATKKEIEYFLLLFLIITGVLYPLGNFTYFDPLTNLISQMKLSFLYGYMGYYLLGYYLYAFTLSARSTKLLYILGMLSLPITFGLTQILSLNANAPVVTFYSYFSLNVILMSTAIFLFYKNYFEYKSLSPKITGLIIVVAKCSFTMYLIHDFLLIIFSRMGIHTLTFPPMVSPLTIAFWVFLLSFIIAFILNIFAKLAFHICKLLLTKIRSQINL